MFKLIELFALTEGITYIKLQFRKIVPIFIFISLLLCCWTRDKDRFE